MRIKKHIRKKLYLLAVLLLLVLLASTATVLSKAKTSNPMPATAATTMDPQILLADTWSYLSSDWATENHLPWSWRSETQSTGDYANPAEIGLYALSWLAAYDLGYGWSPSWSATEAELNAILDQLRAWQTGSQTTQPHGPNAYGSSVFYQWYWISWDPPVVGAASGDNHLVPSIDNAWLAASLITIQSYAEAHNHATMAAKAGAILADMNFSLWYHDDSHLFSWGAVEDPAGGALADYYSNENRLINFIARALGHLEAGEYQDSLAALTASPGTYDGITVEAVSWDGSYFTYAAPAIFIREMATDYGRDTIDPATAAQIAYAQDQGYTAWGLSDCFDIGDGPYIQQGAPPAAMGTSTESVPGLVTPHASALALITSYQAQALTNLGVISSTFPSAYYTGYGFRDSVQADPVNPDYGQVSNRYSALAQEWIFLATANAQTGFIWDYFYRDPGVMAAHMERFGISPVFLPLALNSH